MGEDDYERVFDRTCDSGFKGVADSHVLYAGSSNWSALAWKPTSELRSSSFDSLSQSLHRAHDEQWDQQLRDLCRSFFFEKIEEIGNHGRCLCKVPEHRLLRACPSGTRR